MGEKGVLVFGFILFAALILSPLAEADHECPMCDGSGVCPACHGDGWISESEESWDLDYGECPECNGDGYCHYCGGDGVVESDGGNGEGCSLVYWTSGIAFSCVGLAVWRSRRN